MDNYAEQLAKNSEEFTSLVASAEDARRSYVEAAGRFLKGWYEDCAKMVVTSQHGITSKLTPEQMKLLKSEVETLAAQAAEIVRAEIYPCKYWHDFSKPRGAFRGGYGLLNEALRFAAAQIIPILRKHGYQLAYEVKNSRLVMAGTLSENEEMTDLRKKYDQFSGKVQTNRIAKTNLEEQELRDRASNLWDST